MSSVLISHLVSQQDIPVLKALGKYRWVRWHSANTDPPSTAFEIRIPDAIWELVEFEKQLEAIEGLDPSICLNLFAKSKLIAEGPKVLRPTTDQCEALEHVDVNLSFDEYEQPFPVFLVEIPEDYRRHIAERFGHPCPRLVMLFHDRATQYIIPSCENGTGEPMTMTILSPRTKWKSIEDALQFCPVTDGADIRLGKVLYRIAMNFGLLLTRYGVRDCGPVDPAAYAKQQEIARRKKGHKADRARRLLENTVTRIDFEQDVIFFDNQSSGAMSTGIGAAKRPHWRRGHFRRQRFGEGHSKRQLIFIRPCFVNSETFDRDLADTQYAIRAR